MTKGWRLFCHEPYRIFFPVGIMLGAFGASHWLFYALGIIPAYSGPFHASIQIQLYMSSFVTGFLATAVPRFSETHQAKSGEVIVFLILILATFSFVVTAHPLLAHVSYIALLAALAVFVFRRFLRRNVQYPPVDFVWIPIALLHGACGALLMILSQRGVVPVNLALVAKPMLNQGFMLSLVLGVGGFLGSRILGSRELPDPASLRKGLGSARAVKLAIHAVSGLLFFSTFWLEALKIGTLAYALRALTTTFILIWNRALRIKPLTPGIFPRLVWLSFWMIAAGLWSALLFPKYLVAALHLVFIGGFSLIVFSVSTMVVLSHSGQGERLHRSPWILRLVSVFVPLALFFRVAAAFAPEHYFMVLGIAAALWVVAAAGWLVFSVRFIFRVPGADAFGRAHEEMKKEVSRAC